MADASRPQLVASQTYTVGDADTAVALGSGSLPVLGTPRMLAWCEAATCRGVEGLIPEGSTTVGSYVTVQHLLPSAVGDVIRVRVWAPDVRENKLDFPVDVVDSRRRRVASAQITRVVVDADQFLAGLDD